MTTATARRTRVPLRAVVALALIAGTATATFVARDRGDQPPPPLCHPAAACVAALDGGQTLVSTSRSAAPDAWLEPGADGSVSLVGLDGRTRWRISTGSSTAPQLLAAGDVGTDGVTDYVLGLTHALAEAQSCGTATVAETALVVVDGRTGETEAPFGALPDVCWNARPSTTRPSSGARERSTSVTSRPTGAGRRWSCCRTTPSAATCGTSRRPAVGSWCERRRRRALRTHPRRPSIVPITRRIRRGVRRPGPAAPATRRTRTWRTPCSRRARGVGCSSSPARGPSSTGPTSRPRPIWCGGRETSPPTAGATTGWSTHTSRTAPRTSISSAGARR